MHYLLNNVFRREQDRFTWLSRIAVHLSGSEEVSDTMPIDPL
jgi:hypothetical protein